MSSAPPLIFGPIPTRLVCPFCNAYVTTTIKTRPTAKTHLFAFLCCLIGFSLCCCIFPYCIDSCQGTAHYCPNCHSFLGSYDN